MSQPKFDDQKHNEHNKCCPAQYALKLFGFEYFFIEFHRIVFISGNSGYQPFENGAGCFR
jgi:hypothetical protein